MKRELPGAMRKPPSMGGTLFRTAPMLLPKEGWSAGREARIVKARGGVSAVERGLSFGECSVDQRKEEGS